MSVTLWNAIFYGRPLPTSATTLHTTHAHKGYLIGVLYPLHVASIIYAFIQSTSFTYSMWRAFLSCKASLIPLQSIISSWSPPLNLKHYNWRAWPML